MISMGVPRYVNMLYMFFLLFLIRVEPSRELLAEVLVVTMLDE